VFAASIDRTASKDHQQSGRTASRWPTTVVRHLLGGLAAAQAQPAAPAPLPTPYQRAGDAEWGACQSALV